MKPKDIQTMNMIFHSLRNREASRQLVTDITFIANDFWGTDDAPPDLSAYTLADFIAMLEARIELNTAVIAEYYPEEA